MKKVYVVLGYMNTGSASLTFPEDFDIEGFYENKKDAQAHCDRLNPEEESDDDGDQMFEDGQMVYEVWSVKNLTKKKTDRQKDEEESSVI